MFSLHMLEDLAISSPRAQGREYRGGGGGVEGCDTPSNLKKIVDFAGLQEELYCRAETPPMKFVKGR